MKENEKSPIMEVTEQTLKNCEQVCRMGLKAQEDASKYLSAFCNNPTNLDDKQNQVARVAAMIDTIMPATQKQVEDILNFVSKSTQTTAELVKKTSEAVRTPGVSDGQAKWAEVSKTFLQGMRSNTDTILQLNAHAIDSWIEIMNKNIKVTAMKV